MTDRIAIEFISLFGMPPVEMIETVAALGCDKLGMALAPVVPLPELYPAWNMRSDAALHRDTRRALADHGITVSVAEGFLLFPGQSADSLAADLDLIAELGAQRANLCLLEPDFPAAVAAVGALADLAAERGMGLTLEFLPGIALGDLGAAQRLVEAAARPNLAILLDAMHFFRTGGTIADLRALPPAQIDYAQVCDVPLVAEIESYADEARFERRIPGEGELPLAAFIAALPADRVIGLEVPMRAKALSGMSAADRLRPAIATTRALLEEAQGR